MGVARYGQPSGSASEKLQIFSITTEVKYSLKKKKVPARRRVQITE